MCKSCAAVLSDMHRTNNDIYKNTIICAIFQLDFFERFLDRELWWGGIVDCGIAMPYDCDSDCEIAADKAGVEQKSVF